MAWPRSKWIPVISPDLLRTHTRGSLPHRYSWGDLTSSHTQSDHAIKSLLGRLCWSEVHYVSTSVFPVLETDYSRVQESLYVKVVNCTISARCWGFWVIHIIIKFEKMFIIINILFLHPIKLFNLSIHMHPSAGFYLFIIVH